MSDSIVPKLAVQPAINSMALKRIGNHVLGFGVTALQAFKRSMFEARRGGRHPDCYHARAAHGASRTVNGQQFRVWLRHGSEVRAWIRI